MEQLPCVFLVSVGCFLNLLNPRVCKRRQGKQRWRWIVLEHHDWCRATSSSVSNSRAIRRAVLSCTPSRCLEKARTCRTCCFHLLALPILRASNAFFFQHLEILGDCICESNHAIVKLVQQELPQVHDIPHSRSVASAKLQDHVHKLRESKLGIVLEDVVGKIYEPDDVHAHIVDDSARLIFHQKRLKLRLVDCEVLLVCYAEFLQHGHEHRLDKRESHMFFLDARYHAHHLHEDADKHVHYSQR
mmetsp:Transcript_23622/g.37035  ORF Transcript_23622/g.37035 Transcript_23622/m.37035 type:complete len:245 (-) Transcript_23622:317-1051(-)